MKRSMLRLTELRVYIAAEASYLDAMLSEDEQDRAFNELIDTNPTTEQIQEKINAIVAARHVAA